MSQESAPRESLLPEGYFYHPLGYLWFVLPTAGFTNLPETVDVGGYSLAKKSEFHVTVINARKIAREIAKGDPVETERMERELQTLLSEYLRDHRIEFVRFEEDLRLATAGGLVSIAARCVMNGVEGYFDMIRQRYGIVVPSQPTHVSIYTLPGTGAVGIDSKEEMEHFTKVALPEVQKVVEGAV